MHLFNELNLNTLGSMIMEAGYPQSFAKVLYAISEIFAPLCGFYGSLYDSITQYNTLGGLIKTLRPFAFQIMFLTQSNAKYPPSIDRMPYLKCQRWATTRDCTMGEYHLV